LSAATRTGNSETLLHRKNAGILQETTSMHRKNGFPPRKRTLSHRQSGDFFQETISSHRKSAFLLRESILSLRQAPGKVQNRCFTLKYKEK
ncbi:MAG: hypothetical protein Q4D17_08420, partial [Planctomycetia bacterium]|nr:hypothetical protein [Planctomycetia bacterium]